MSRNPLLFGDVLSAEEHVLGCMCDSFRSSLGQTKGNPFSSINDQYQWRGKNGRKKAIHYLKKRSIISFYCIVLKFMVSIGANPIISILNWRWKKNSSLVTNGYPLSEGNPIFKAEILCLYSCKNGLRGSATQLIFIIKYRYCIGRSRCERPMTR